MKTSDPDEFPSPDLAAWRIKPSRNPQFRAAVWARVEAGRRDGSWRGYARAHAPVLAGALAAAVVAGAWIGREQARARVAADRAAIATQYVRALDARTMR